MQNDGRKDVLFFFFNCSIVDLQCVLISAVQQSDSVIHIYPFSYYLSLWLITGY